MHLVCLSFADLHMSFTCMSGRYPMAGRPLRIAMLLTEQEPHPHSGLCEEEEGRNGVLSPFSGAEPAGQGLHTGHPRNNGLLC